MYMRKLLKGIATLFLLSFLLVEVAIAQAPQAINYQAIARDASGNPYVSRPISVRLSVNTGIKPRICGVSGNTKCNYQSVWFVYR